MSAPDTRALPSGMLALGWSGVLPFAGALALAMARPPWRELAQTLFIAYGAVILSFLGDARWSRGLAADASPARYVEAVLPSLIGFAALLLLAGSFLVWLLIDLRDPLWFPAYRRMRLGISAMVLALHAGWLLVWEFGLDLQARGCPTDH